MKKITSAQRIAEIFTNEPLDACDVLLDVAQSILKQRRGGTPKKARRKLNDSERRVLHVDDAKGGPS